METIIVIPTYRRPTELQTTLAVLAKVPGLWPKVAVVVEGTKEALKGRYAPPAEPLASLGAIVVPSPAQGRGIGIVRQWCLDHFAGSVVWFWDDDIKGLAVRTVDKHGKNGLRSYEREPGLAKQRVKECVMLGEKFAVVGMAERFLSNYRPLIEVNRKSATVFSVNTVMAKAHGMEFIKTFAQDIDIALQAAHTGAGNVHYAGLAWTAAATQTEGGCATTRTHEKLIKAHELVVSRFPEVATRKVRKLKSTWADGSNEMSVVSVRWARIKMPKQLAHTNKRKYESLADLIAEMRRKK